MQMPNWARREPGQPPAKPSPKKGAAAAPPQGPTIRDDEWWIDRMRIWRVANPDAKLPAGKLGFWLDIASDAKPNDGLSDSPTNLDQLLDRYIEGENLIKLAEWLTELFGFRVSHAHLRMALTASDERLRRYNLAREHFAHRLVDEALEDAQSARRTGDYRYSGDMRVKLAGKMLPSVYGDKSQIELGGIAGKPIESKVTQTPAEAMKAALG